MFGYSSFLSQLLSNVVFARDTQRPQDDVLRTGSSGMIAIGVQWHATLFNVPQKMQVPGHLQVVSLSRFSAPIVD